MQVKIKKLHPDAIIPQYQTTGAACFDIHSLDDGYIIEKPKTFRTGLSFEIPHGYVMLVFSRSGHGFKQGIRLANCVGVIDSDYRGDLFVKLTPDEPGVYLTVNHGDRIAQAMILPIPLVQLVESDDLSDTARGAGGFGSTGA